MKKLLAALLALTLVFSLTACGGWEAETAAAEEETTAAAEEEMTAAAEETPEAEPAGDDTIYVGLTSLAGSLDPAESWSLTSHGIGEAVYKMNADGTLTSRFVKDLSQKDDYTWTLELNPGVFFSDGAEVNAQLFCDGINKLMEVSDYAPAGGAGRMSCTPTGDYTLELTTEVVTRVLPCNLCEWSVVLFKDNADGSYSYTGPYIPVNVEPGVRIDMEPNPYFPNAELRPNVTLLAFKDAASMKLAFEGGEIDMAATITSDVVEMLQNEGLKTVTFDAGYQYFIQCNLESPVIGDPAVRQAINLGLDREEMITALKGGHPAGGLFANYHPFAGDCFTDRNVEEANRLLEEDGWTLGEDGIREKDGQKLEIRFITYASRPDLPTLLLLATSQLEEIGVKCSTEIVDNIMEACGSGDFDLAFYAQNTAPTGDPASFLKMSFTAEGASNFSHYANPAYDEAVAKLGDLPLGEERNELTREAQRLLYADLPCLFVIDPQWHIAVSDRLADYVPYCGDYYFINEDFGLNQ